MDLYCLPYAGATAAVYKKWEKLHGGELRIQPIELPGRGRKFGQMLLSNMEQLIVHVFEDLKEGQPNNLMDSFGHSLGGMLAYRLAEKVGQAGLALPRSIYLFPVYFPACRKTLHDRPYA